jgi:two-component system chemotaxis sensor kinase CheA
MAKYVNLFLEEGNEQLAEMSRGLLTLEKDPASADSIDLIFRMAHSIKSMAASLGFDSISEVAHRLEDRMQSIRSDGRVSSGDLSLLFRGLEAMERMVAHVREHGEPPPVDESLVEALRAEPGAPPDGADPNPKKALT